MKRGSNDLERREGMGLSSTKIEWELMEFNAQETNAGCN